MVVVEVATRLSGQRRAGTVLDLQVFATLGLATMLDRVLRVSQLDVNGAELLFQTWRLRVTPTPFDAAFYVCECVVCKRMIYFVGTWAQHFKFEVPYAKYRHLACPREYGVVCSMICVGEPKRVLGLSIRI